VGLFLPILYYDTLSVKINELLFGYIEILLYVSFVIRDKDMTNELEINPILLDERYDEQIQNLLMFERFDGKIFDSGKIGSDRIYEVLKDIESETGIKL